MNFNPVSVVNVSLMWGNEKQAVGRLAIKNRQIFFEYADSFIQTGLEISPFKLPVKPGVHVCEDRVFDGLFGVFNDSLPDGWGRLLLDRKLQQSGVSPGNLSPLDRLCFVGNNGMGALVYKPEMDHTEAVEIKSLDVIAEEIYATLEEEDNSYIDELLCLNGSSAGARPKIMMRHNQADWLIKFRSSLDSKDIGAIEFAYHLMAKKAGMDVPEAKLFPAKKGPGYFGVKRFDRDNSSRVHMHTISGLLHADHRLPNLDYETILRTTAWLTKDVRETQKQYRAAVFNILSHNRDDHAKNFSFLLDKDGAWRVSPAYDLTFSSGPQGEHCTMIMGEGKNPQSKNLLQLAKVAGIKDSEACNIIDKVKTAVVEWRQIATDVGVSQESIKFIETALS